MDKSVAPGNDFDAYSNGTWMKNTPIPADKASYGTWAVLRDTTRERMRKIDESSEEPKIADFYSTYMDEPGIEAKGLASLKPELDAIAAIADRQALARELGAELRADVDALNATNFSTPNFLGVWVTQGLTDPSHTLCLLASGWP